MISLVTGFICFIIRYSLFTVKLFISALREHHTRYEPNRRRAKYQPNRIPHM